MHHLFSLFEWLWFGLNGFGLNGVCSREEGYDLDESEAKEAVKLLDRNGDGLISFEEFVEWSQNKVNHHLWLMPCVLPTGLCQNFDVIIIVYDVSCLKA